MNAEDPGKKKRLLSKCETCATNGNKLCVCRRRKRKKGEDGMGRVDGGGGAPPGSGQHKGKGKGKGAGKAVGNTGGVGLAVIYAAAAMEVGLFLVEVQSIHISSLRSIVVFACSSSNLECVF